eukprot:TRINITY_DN6011_c0_g2_i4.p1 TRINITY_DN6011_c0_g2~~TRINITY_DN6011_c0_g2_i4.p1  ORF type:complete len:630 (-),score=156.63 TRINITY_DN6011_c0_g2_i4:102-1991(-)
MLYNPVSNELVVVTNDQNIVFFNSSTLDKIKFFIGYNDQVIDVKFLKEETKIIVATNSEQIRIFDTATWDCQVLEGHKDICLTVDPSECKNYAFSGSKDNTVRLWDLETLTCLGYGEGHLGSVSAVAFSKRSKTFCLSGSEDKTIKQWNISSACNGKGSPEFAIPVAKTIIAHEKDINSIAIAPNDKIFASGSQDKTCKIWSLPDMTLKGVLKGHKRGVWCVEFSPVDQVVATASGDQTVKIWSVKDYTCLKTFEGHLNSVLRVSFITKGMQLVSAGSDGLVKLWTIKTNECVDTFDSHTDKIWALAVHPDENVVVSGAGDSVLNVWKDVTKEVEEEKIAAAEKLILKEQEIQNFLALREFKNALALAFELEQPHRILRIFESLIEGETEADMVDVLTSLPEKELGLCFSYMRDWNTSGKQAFVTQKVLMSIMSNIPIERIKKLPNIAEIVDAMIPYTQRHMNRITTLAQRSFLLDFTLQSMNVISMPDVTPIAVDLANKPAPVPSATREVRKRANPSSAEPTATATTTTTTTTTTTATTATTAESIETDEAAVVNPIALLIQPNRAGKQERFPEVNPISFLGSDESKTKQSTKSKARDAKKQKRPRKQKRNGGDGNIDGDDDDDSDGL